MSIAAPPAPRRHRLSAVLFIGGLALGAFAFGMQFREAWAAQPPLPPGQSAESGGDAIAPETDSPPQPAVSPAEDAADKALKSDAPPGDAPAPSEFEGPDWEPAGYAGEEKERWSGSVMFPLKDLRSLNKVLDAYQRGVASGLEDPNSQQNGESAEEDPLNKILEELTPEQYTQAEPEAEIPFFYLGSIMYASPDSWSVWLNGRRIASTAQEQEIKNVEVASLGKDFVELRWRPNSMAAVQERWDAHLENPEDLKKLGRAEFDIAFHKDNTVTFILRPNQTLYTDVMEIVEGRRMEPRALLLRRMRGKQDGGGENAEGGADGNGGASSPEGNANPASPGSGRPKTDEERAGRLMNQYLDAGKALGLVPQPSE